MLYKHCIQDVSISNIFRYKLDTSTFLIIKTILFDFLSCLLFGLLNVIMRSIHDYCRNKTRNQFSNAHFTKFIYK